MSAISTLIAQARAFVTTLRSSIWAIDVRDGIADSIQKLSEAIEQCYSDVSNPTLQTEALEAALQNKIDEGEMAALTIGDHTITAAKLAQGVIDNTLATSGAAADAKKTGDEISAIKADLDSLMEPQRLTDGTDLNTVTTPGTYTLHTSAAYTNKPTEDTEHGILEVWHEDYENNLGRVFQRLTYTYKAGRTCTEIWTRSLGVTTMMWTPWVSVVNADDWKNVLQSQTGIITKVDGSYIDLITDPVSLTPVVNAEWSHSIVSCTEGDKFIINAEGGQRPRAWGFLDSSNHILSVADASTVVEGLQLTAPTNAVKLIINDRSGAVSYIPSAFLLTKIAESAQGKVDIQQSPGDYGKALVINRDGQVRPGVVSGGSGLTDSVKVALLACFKHVLWDDEHSVDYYDALEAALYAAESRLTAVIDYGNATVFTDDPFAKIKWLLKVYYDGAEVNPSDYTLTGDLIAGQNVLTITYNGETTSIMVRAEEAMPQRITFADGDLLRFNGWGMTSASDGHRPPYLVALDTARVYYFSKGHAPYNNTNSSPVNGVYPVPIPAFASHVRVSVAPNNYKIAVNCWRYNNSTKNYTFIEGTDTGLSVFHADVDVPQFPDNARALNIIIAKPDSSAITPSEEPTQVVVFFS